MAQMAQVKNGSGEDGSDRSGYGSEYGTQPNSYVFILKKKVLIGARRFCIGYGILLFLDASSHSISGFDRSSVGPSVGRSIGPSRFRKKKQEHPMFLSKKQPEEVY